MIKETFGGAEEAVNKQHGYVVTAQTGHLDSGGTSFRPVASRTPLIEGRPDKRTRQESIVWLFYVSSFGGNPGQFTAF